METSSGNAAAALSVVLGVLALVTGPAALVGSRYSTVLTLHRSVALGGAVAGLLGILALLCARRGRFRAARSVLATGDRAARRGGCSARSPSASASQRRSRSERTRS